MDLWSLGREPIRPEQPAGADVRGEPVFEVLQAEIDKLFTPSAAGGTDWVKVNQLATEILAGKSKDLLVAGYLAVALIKTRQFEGFAAGLRVYGDLLERYWEDLYPPKKRMRGRTAAIEWWVEKSDTALQLMQAEPPAPEDLDACRQDLLKIDSLLQGYLDTPPLTRPLHRFIDSIAVSAQPKTEAEAAPPQEQGSSDRPVPPREPPAAGIRAEPEKAAAPADTQKIASPSEGDKLLRAALQTMSRVADHLQNAEPSNPRSYRWRRIAGWAMIQTLPPATDGRTQVPPPLNAAGVRADLNGLKAKGNWTSLLQAAEERFHGSLLWLDLNRFVSEALAGLGKRYKEPHDALCQETAFLAFRLPGIETLSFSDGMPFADAETLHWLDGIRIGEGRDLAQPLGQALPIQDPGDGRMAEITRQAGDLAKEKKIGEAASLLHHELLRSSSKREQLLWRLRLSQLLMNAKELQLALPHLESVLRDVDAYSLEEWDPRFALEGLKIVWQGFSSSSAESVKRAAADVLNRISKLDPAEALLIARR